MTSAPSPLPFPSNDERRVEPSMEEILASIRKIIADDEAPVLRGSLKPADDAAAARPAPAPIKVEPPRPAAVLTPVASAVAAHSRPGPPIFGLSRPAAPAGIPVPGVRPQDPARPEPLAEPLRPAEPESLQDAHAPAEALSASAPSRAVGEGALVSSQTTNTVSSAFQALSASVALTAGDAIDRHVREMLRPLLRSWLDDNLPVIVEKLVRAEIERVARGGR